MLSLKPSFLEGWLQMCTSSGLIVPSTLKSAPFFTDKQAFPDAVNGVQLERGLLWSD